MVDNAVFWGACCAIAWGFSDFIARFAGRSVGVIAATFAMMTIGTVLVGLTIVIDGQALNLHLQGIHWLIIMGIGVGLGSILFYHAVTHGPVAIAAPVVSCYPAIAIPISIVFGSQPNNIVWVAMAVTLSGVWVVARMGPKSVEGNTEFSPHVIRRTILYSLLAATIWGVSLQFADLAIEEYGPTQTLLAMRIIGVIILAIAMFLRKESFKFSFNVWPILIIWSLLDTGGHLFLFLGLATEHGEYAIIASVGYTIVTVLLARFILKEQVSLPQWGGIALVILGVALLSYFN